MLASISSFRAAAMACLLHGQHCFPTKGRLSSAVTLFFELVVKTATNASFYFALNYSSMIMFFLLRVRLHGVEEGRPSICGAYLEAYGGVLFAFAAASFAWRSNRVWIHPAQTRSVEITLKQPSPLPPCPPPPRALNVCFFLVQGAENASRE